MAMFDATKKLNKEELKEVAGGGYNPKYNGDYYELWFICSYCQGYEELIYSHKIGEPANGGYISGEFHCPKCGFTDSFYVKI